MSGAGKPWALRRVIRPATACLALLIQGCPTTMPRAAKPAAKADKPAAAKKDAAPKAAKAEKPAAKSTKDAAPAKAPAKKAASKPAPKKK